jgi:hypothetical protein
MSNRKLQVVQLGTNAFAVADEHSMSLMTVAAEQNSLTGEEVHFGAFYSERDAKLFCLIDELVEAVTAASSRYPDHRLIMLAHKIKEIGD